MTWMFPLLLACLQNSVPFTMDLPESYGAFETDPQRAGTWSATRADGLGKVSVGRFDLGVPGAQLDAVLEDIANRQWRPRVKELPESSLDRWSGTMSGLDAGGWEIRYRFNESMMAVTQQVAITGNYLILMDWSGPAAAREGMKPYFQSLQLPPEWLPEPTPTVDAARGLSGDLHSPFPGSLSIALDLRSLEEEERIDVLVTYHPAEPEKEPVVSGEPAWRLPGAAVRLPVNPGDGRYDVRYSLNISESHNYGNAYGITRLPGDSFAALDPLWIALPMFLVESEELYAPPAWSLTVYHSAHLRCMTARPVLTNFQEDTGVMTSAMTQLEAGQAWPFLVMAQYQQRREQEGTWWLRLDAKARTPKEALKARRALVETATELWGEVPEFTLASFPYVGDRVLPGLLLLDEQRGWFDKPIDGQLDEAPRLVQLARLIAQQRFGARLRGEGTAAQFLERSLAEFATARILEDVEWPEADTMAEELRQSWRKREESAGELPLPLSLIPVDDLYGARRLLSFGPLVWAEIETKMGQEAFDSMLKERTASPTRWSCADLEKELRQRAPDVDWEPFLRASLYGRDLP
jgi:hypothetical protein